MKYYTLMRPVKDFAFSQGWAGWGRYAKMGFLRLTFNPKNTVRAAMKMTMMTMQMIRATTGLLYLLSGDIAVGYQKSEINIRSKLH